MFLIPLQFLYICSVFVAAESSLLDTLSSPRISRTIGGAPLLAQTPVLKSTCATVKCPAGLHCQELANGTTRCTSLLPPVTCTNTSCPSDQVCQINNGTIQCNPPLTCSTLLCSPPSEICKEINGKPQCVEPSCESTRCPTNTTCVRREGRVFCVPQNKPGTCPQRSLRPCSPADNTTDLCFDDSICRGDQKCCSDVCRKECKSPILTCAMLICGGPDTTCVVVDGQATCQPRVRPGQCPALPPQNFLCVKNPVNKCEDDSVCKAGQKCCSNHCFLECQSSVIEPLVRPGQCPALPPQNFACLAHPVNKCENDSVCLPGQKCCTNHCFLECKAVKPECSTLTCGPDRKCIVIDGNESCEPRVRPGQCPTLPAQNLLCTRNPTNQCEDDSVCNPGQKCCSNKCFLECKPVEPVCSTSTCSSTSCASVCVEVTTAKSTVVSPKCVAPSDTNDYCTDKSNACEADQTCLVKRSCFNESCFPAVTCSPFFNENPCDTADCGPNEQCVVVDGSSPMKAKCVGLNGSSKPGQCRTLWPGTVGSCIIACQNDSSCKGDMKCCSNGCGRTCQAPASPVKSGQCPKPPGGAAPCLVTCTEDTNCTGTKKCCSNGCGITCQEPAPSAKAGKCPTLPPGTIGSCIEACQSDNSCKGNFKCCSNGCGHTCQAPATKMKSGQCPAPPKGPSPCIAQCEVDANCTGTLKCCSNGCGITCQEPVQSNKPGRCPAVPPGTVGACLEACSSDSGCTGDNKCCSNGCGHTCEPPARACTLDCIRGFHCEIESIPCGPHQQTNCPSSHPVCVPDTLSSPATELTTTPSPSTLKPTCAGVECLPGLCCQLQTVICDQVPCRNTSPECVKCQSTTTTTAATQPSPTTTSTARPYKPAGPTGHLVTIEDDPQNNFPDPAPYQASAQQSSSSFQY